MAHHHTRPTSHRSPNQGAIQDIYHSSNTASLHRRTTPTQATNDLRQCLQYLKRVLLVYTGHPVFNFLPSCLHHKVRLSSQPWLSNKDNRSLNFNIILVSNHRNKGPASDQMRKDLEWTSAGSWIRGTIEFVVQHLHDDCNDRSPPS
jgi:hypothetical protein